MDPLTPIWEGELPTRSRQARSLSRGPDPRLDDGSEPGIDLVGDIAGSSDTAGGEDGDRSRSSGPSDVGLSVTLPVLGAPVVGRCLFRRRRRTVRRSGSDSLTNTTSRR